MPIKSFTSQSSKLVILSFRNKLWIRISWENSRGKKTFCKAIFFCHCHSHNGKIVQSHIEAGAVVVAFIFPRILIILPFFLCLQNDNGVQGLKKLGNWPQSWIKHSHRCLICYSIHIELFHFSPSVGNGAAGLYKEKWGHTFSQSSDHYSKVHSRIWIDHHFQIQNSKVVSSQIKNPSS